MLRQIILKISFAIVVTFSFTNSVSAQLKSISGSNQVLVDLSVIDVLSTESSSRQSIRIKGKQGFLLKPPTEMPRSRYLIKSPATEASRKLARIKFKPKFEPSKKRYKRRKISNKTPLQLSKRRILKQPSSKFEMLKSRSEKKLAPTPKQNFKRRTKPSKTIPIKPVFNKKILAPTQKAVPLATVKILKMPPLTPKLSKTTTKIKENPQQIASLPKKSVQQSATNLLTFKQGDSKLSNQAKKTLDTLLKKLNAEPNHRLQVRAYAGEPNLSASKARRLSLSRALSVRSHLIKNGIRSTRIDVRALGNKTAVGEPNRVDIEVIKN